MIFHKLFLSKSVFALFYKAEEIFVRPSDYLSLIGILGFLLSIFCLILVLKLYAEAHSSKRKSKGCSHDLQQKNQDDKYYRLEDSIVRQENNNGNYISNLELDRKLEKIKQEFKDYIISRTQQIINSKFTELGIISTINNGSSKVDLQPEKKAMNYFYLKMPDPKGFFWNDQLSETPESDTYYMLTIETENPARGKFKPVDNELLQKRAIMEFDIALKPVCLIEGGTFRPGKKILVIKEGLLHLTGNKWEIENSNKCIIQIA